MLSLKPPTARVMSLIHGAIKQIATRCSITTQIRLYSRPTVVSNICQSLCLAFTYYDVPAEDCARGWHGQF